MGALSVKIGDLEVSFGALPVDSQLPRREDVNREAEKVDPRTGLTPTEAREWFNSSG